VQQNHGQKDHDQKGQGQDHKELSYLHRRSSPLSCLDPSMAGYEGFPAVSQSVNLGPSQMLPEENKAAQDMKDNMNR